MKLLLIGAGIRTPLLIHGLIQRQDALNLREVVLFDTDQSRLAMMSWMAREIARRNDAAFTVTSSPELREAAAGATFIFSAIRTGQEQSRVDDERIALDLGVLGQETTGPGGFSMALRTIPVLLEYARVIEEAAPDAWFVNFTNPAGLITQALRDETSLNVVGICDTPTAMRTTLAAYHGCDLDDVSLDYVGLNHLGWARDVKVRGQSVLQRVLDDYETLQVQAHEWALFDPDLVRGLGMLPNEYLFYFYYREHAIENIIASRSTRGEQVEQLNRPLWADLADAHGTGNAEGALDVYAHAMLSRSSSYMARESGGEVVETEHDASSVMRLFADEGYAGLAMDVMQAIVRDRKAMLVLNVRNDGCLGELEDNDVIETTCVVDAAGIRPLAQRALPETIRGLVVSVKTYERYAVRAAVYGDREAAVMALAVHPLVMSWSLAEQLVERYVSHYQDMLPQFAGSG